MSVLTWVEQRTGAISALNDFLTEDVPGGASYWYVFGSATMFAMILQIVTGIFLTFYYAPSVDSAYESTQYIYQHVPFGHFVISLHYWGATAMIALVLMHLLQVLVWGAYKAPRELSWIVGVLLLVITLVLGLTGYLLPWDMNAYFASQVAINIAGSVPIVGTPTQQFLSGGPGIGTLTINRFFGLHVWAMPALLVLLVGAHLAIFRHNGGAGPPVDTELKKLPQGRFWPNQMFMDAVASFGVFVVIVLLAFMDPVPLDDKADPTKNFTPYPAWYFLALYGLLRVAGSGPQGMVPFLNLLATVVIPGAAVTLLIALPFIDRNPSRQLSRRPVVLGLTAVSVVLAVGLSIYSQMAIVAEENAGSAPAVAAGVTTGGAGGAGGAGVHNPSGGAAAGASAGGDLAAGGKVYATNCAACHSANGAGVVGPQLFKNPYVTGDAKPVIGTLLNGMNAPIEVAGKKYAGGMPPWSASLSHADIANVITYIRQSWGNKASTVKTADVDAVAK